MQEGILPCTFTNKNETLNPEYSVIRKELVVPITYIPLDHGGSLTSSTDSRALRSADETSFKRGAGGLGVYAKLFETGKTT